LYRQTELSTEPFAITAQRASLVSSIRRRLAERLVESRLTHVMGVEGMGVMLAHRWGVPADAVLLAALLHDYCKGLPKGELRAALDRLSDYPATAEDRDHPELWHGLAAAQAAIDEYRVDDPRILQAVAHHTTGIPGLNPVGLVLYVADTFEPSRRYPLVEEHRRALDKADLLEAALLAAQVKLQQLESANRTVHSNTRLMAEWLERQTATVPTPGD
jgi:predicted HD superfamily hydrolase involved in NAD metabolism